MLKVQDNLAAVTSLLRNLDQSSNGFDCIARTLKPALGTKVGRQTWLKGRSIKHCFDMGGRQKFSCEQKIDGEYCQIHIDLSKPVNPIQIFSKSGKDSTQDRQGLHG
jgi:DNA ligase-4